MLSNVRNALRIPVAGVARLFQTSVPRTSEKFDHKRIPQEDEGVQGEKVVDLDSVLKTCVIYLLIFAIQRLLFILNIRNWLVFQKTELISNSRF